MPGEDPDEYLAHAKATRPDASLLLRMSQSDAAWLQAHRRGLRLTWPQYVHWLRLTLQRAPK